jgi:hypothetical protein
VSVLLVGLDDELTSTLVTRLRAQDDEVRVLIPTASKGEPWRQLGAYVATGPSDDADLIERAAQNVRTVVLGLDEPEGLVTLDAVLEGARLAKVGRLIVFGPAAGMSLRARLQAAGMEYVALVAAPRGFLGRKRFPADKLAEAIDAADDLVGPVHLVLDLGKAATWDVLGVVQS